MQVDMKIDAGKIRAAREARGWSQDHLAQVAGLGVRTVQRVESDGSASKETLLCLSAALQLALEDLQVTPAARRSSAMDHVPATAPWYVRYGLYGLYTPEAAKGFMWLSMGIAAISLFLGFLRPLFWSGCLLAVAALWYWAAAHWLTHRGGWPGDRSGSAGAG